MKSRITLLCLTALFFLSALWPARAQPATFKLLHSFSASTKSTNTGGSFPLGLVLSGNTLYGTAEYSESGGSGTVFTLNTSGTGFTALYSFTALVVSEYPYVNHDGAQPEGLILAGNVLYGTAE